MSLKILLDTTYILPSLGIEVDVDKAVFEKLRKLLKKEKAECYYYSPFSVFEALWKVSKTVSNSNLFRVSFLVLKCCAQIKV